MASSGSTGSCQRPPMRCPVVNPVVAVLDWGEQGGSTGERVPPVHLAGHAGAPMLVYRKARLVDTAQRRASRTPRGSGSLLTLTASESGDSPRSAERSPPEPEPELTPREVRQREREARRGERPQGMVPGRERRRTKLERGSMRVVATGGIIGIAVVLGAVLVGQDVAGWIVGLVVGLTSVILAALLWSSRQL
jgi:hypothetical protein